MKWAESISLRWWVGDLHGTAHQAKARRFRMLKSIRISALSRSTTSLLGKIPPISFQSVQQWSRFLVRYPMTTGQRLVSSLDRKAANPDGLAALASPADTSGPSDKRPVLVQHAEQGAFSSTENILPRHGMLAWNPAHVQLGGDRVGEPSLPGDLGCLSLQRTILA
jgi:hypothetical protein